VFSGFRRCLYPKQKFDSDAERRFAVAALAEQLVQRPTLISLFRDLREIEGGGGEDLRRALLGGGRHPRSPETAARGIRVLGETNWGPISPLSNMMQGIFGVLAPGQLLPNLVSVGVTGSVATQSEGLMQDYKTGHIIGSTPRYLTYAQLIAVPVGAAAVAIVYPLLRDTYGIGGEHGLQSPISQRFAGFGRILSQGVDALPPGAVVALAIGVVFGIVLTLLEGTKFHGVVPSPTGIGIGMLVPGSAVVSMFLGAVIAEIWKWARPKQANQNLIPLASGFIAGEALIAVIIPILVAVGIVTLH